MSLRSKVREHRLIKFPISKLEEATNPENSSLLLFFSDSDSPLHSGSTVKNVYFTY